MSESSTNLNNFVLSEENYQLFSEYLGWSDREAIFQHVSQVRDKALNVFQFYIVSEFKLLRMKTHPFYPSLLALSKKREDLKLLDLGCCFGADLRKLSLDGFPAGNLTGLDISTDFLELGYELFKDKDTSPTKFISADILSDDWPTKVAGLEFDIIYLGSFLHLFSQSQQEKILERVSHLLKPNGILFGRNLGSGEKEPICYMSERLKGERFFYTPQLLTETLKSLGFGDIDVVTIPKEQLEDFQNGTTRSSVHPFLIYTAVKNGV
ncbi:S-adenosyl-L-methionine-dependent methyltransferase [Basidiobolus meristosporus CBS 931.73]|uniref:S-adenosyl-L-methionine-dependent methyltransferase n=1 Tax=Basidiobolus meristosporus CBS 931.73 TaxID=1314790 RepID=A0A1Y1Y4G4_9FUNG|nr:S-adenosyl-L-methionine-dependent methyltransferase [Basidiobolus meristosporus CBS 931.73]|eukprot:ORX92606.1 S-adenosyl-L-methionine-dependent methyltransferase [Basidiobolus meristosporus CBS 931.73]